MKKKLPEGIEVSTVYKVGDILFEKLPNAENYVECMELIPLLEDLLEITDIEPELRPRYSWEEVIDFILDNRRELKEIL